MLLKHTGQDKEVKLSREETGSAINISESEPITDRSHVKRSAWPFIYFFVVVLFSLLTSGSPRLLLFCWPPSPLRWQPSTHTHTHARTVWLSQTAAPPQFQYLGFFQQVPWLSIGSWNGQRIFAGWPATINWLCCGSVGILNLYSQHSIPALSDDMNKLLFSGARPRCNRTWGMDFARLASLV